MRLWPRGYAAPMAADRLGVEARFLLPAGVRASKCEDLEQCGESSWF